jgi:hypothetical protein
MRVRALLGGGSAHSRPGLGFESGGLLPDQAPGVGTVGAGLAGPGALDLGRAIAGLGGEGVEDLEDVAECLQQRGRVVAAAAWWASSSSLARSRRLNSAGSAWCQLAGWPLVAARLGIRSRTSFMPTAPGLEGRAGRPVRRSAGGPGAALAAGWVAAGREGWVWCPSAADPRLGGARPAARLGVAHGRLGGRPAGWGDRSGSGAAVPPVRPRPGRGGGPAHAHSLGRRRSTSRAAGAGRQE